MAAWEIASAPDREYPRDCHTVAPGHASGWPGTRRRGRLFLVSVRSAAVPGRHWESRDSGQQIIRVWSFSRQAALAFTALANRRAAAAPSALNQARWCSKIARTVATAQRPKRLDSMDFICSGCSRGIGENPEPLTSRPLDLDAAQRRHVDRSVILRLRILMPQAVIVQRS